MRQLTFIEPMPGFALDTGFTLSDIDPAGLLQSLRSERDPALRFVITPADAFFADYRASVAGSLAGILGGRDIELFLVLTIGASLDQTTANLRAPIAVDPDSGRAVQVILDDDTLPMRHPLAAR